MQVKCCFCNIKICFWCSDRWEVVDEVSSVKVKHVPVHTVLCIFFVCCMVLLRETFPFMVTFYIFKMHFALHVETIVPSFN